MSISGTWPIRKSQDGATWQDAGSAVGPCTYEAAWMACAALNDADPDGYTYEPAGEYKVGIDSGVSGAPLIEPDPPIDNFHGVPPEAGAYVQSLSDASDPHQSYGCSLVGPG